MKHGKQETLKHIQEQFIPELENLFGDALEAVVLYGSAAGTEFNPDSSDINLLVITAKPVPEKLIELGKAGKKQIQKHRISMQIQTLEEFTSSSDVFPMEYLDMINRREILLGTDPLEGITVDPAHLRHQVEERLRGSVNAFRQALLSSGKSDKALRRILVEWFGAQTALLRGLLRLKKEEHIPFGADALAGRVADRYGIDGTPFSKLSTLRDGGKQEDKATAIAPLILTALTDLARIVDRMEA